MKCKICQDEVIVNNKFSTFIICDKCQAENNVDKYKIFFKDDKSYRICFKCKKEFELSPKSRRYICDDCQEKDEKPEVIFAKKEHFGYRGLASDGHKWWSLNEQDLEEWLIHNNVKHVPHPRLGESLKRADQYLPDYDLYIEIDGLRRIDDIDWHGKLSLYDKLGLKYKITKPVRTHFHEDMNKCFEEMNEVFDFISRDKNKEIVTNEVCV